MIYQFVIRSLEHAKDISEQYRLSLLPWAEMRGVGGKYVGIIFN